MSTHIRAYRPQLPPEIVEKILKKRNLGARFSHARVPYTKYTSADAQRMEELLHKHPQWQEVLATLEHRMNSGVDDFVINIGSAWKKRQLAHIVANKNGWYSRKVMTTDTEYGNRNARCDKCCCMLTVDSYSCCARCDGYCPNGCSSDLDSHPQWGDVQFSQRPLSVGRKKRRRRNQWKYKTFV